MTRIPIVATGLLLWTTPVWGQAPFSVIDLRFHWTVDVSNSPLQEHWHPGRGAELGLTMPFYTGDLELGATVHRYATRSEVPGYAAVWLYAGWGEHVVWNDWLALFGAVRLGNYHMSFDDADESFVGISTENEMTVGLGGGLAALVAGPLWLYMRTDYLRITTLPAMDLWYMSVGLRVQIRAGKDWIDFFE